MTWLKHKVADRWYLFPSPNGGHVKESLGAVERIGIAYEARDRDGLLIAKRSSRQRAMMLVEEAEKISVSR